MRGRAIWDKLYEGDLSPKLPGPNMRSHQINKNFVLKLILLKASGKLKNSGQLQNSTVNRAILITINRVFKIATSNSMKLLIQKRQLQNLRETSISFKLLIIVSPFVLLGKILLPYLIILSSLWLIITQIRFFFFILYFTSTQISYLQIYKHYYEFSLLDRCVNTH